QLLAMLAPRQTSDMVTSLLADAAQGGGLPKWPVASVESAQINGDSADAFIASAYAFGARGFDVRQALADMVRGATDPTVSNGGHVERQDLAQYLAKGHVPDVPGASPELAKPGQPGHRLPRGAPGGRDVPARSRLPALPAAGHRPGRVRGGERHPVHVERSPEPEWPVRRARGKRVRGGQVGRLLHPAQRRSQAALRLGRERAVA